MYLSLFSPPDTEIHYGRVRCHRSFPSRNFFANSLSSVAKFCTIFRTYQKVLFNLSCTAFSCVDQSLSTTRRNWFNINFMLANCTGPRCSKEVCDSVHLLSVKVSILWRSLFKLSPKPNPRKSWNNISAFCGKILARLSPELVPVKPKLISWYTAMSVKVIFILIIVQQQSPPQCLLVCYSVSAR